MTAPRVLVVQESLPQYRVAFFERLRDRLRGEDVELDLAHGEPVAAVAARGDGGTLDWAIQVPNHRLRVGGHVLVWQPAHRLATGSSLVVVEQASRMLLNYLLLGRQTFGGPPVALWGHGANLQSDDSLVTKLAEQAKRTLSRRPHWWFAYTEGSAERVRATGFPQDRITVVQNAADTSWAEIPALRAKVPGRCVYVGSLDRRKCLDLLVAAADEVARLRPDFELVMVGDGPDRARVLDWAATRSHLRYVGPLFGSAKAQELSQAELVLNPGLVGLSIVDAFAAGAPLVTTEFPLHSPEVEYLDNGRNGLVTAHDRDAYARSVGALLGNRLRLRTMQDRCRQDARRYSLDAMVDRFAGGVHAALRSTARGRLT